MNHELSFVATWLKANKLTLHPDKTKFILFHPARKKIDLDGLSISVNKNSINRVEHTKFLGVIIHQNLSWQAHIKAISSKIAKSTGIIIKSRQFFLSNTLCTLSWAPDIIQLFNTPISSILLYYLGIHLLFSFTTPFPSPEESFMNHYSFSTTCTYLPAL